MAAISPESFVASATIDLRAQATPMLASRFASRQSLWENTAFARTKTIIDLTGESRRDLLDGSVAYEAGYQLTATELAEYEAAIIGLVAPDMISDTGLAILLIDGVSPLVDWSRTMEMTFGWYDMPDWMRGFERQTKLALIIDFEHPNGPSITIASRMLFCERPTATSSGSQIVDSLADRLSTDEVLRYYDLPDFTAWSEVVTLYNVPGRARTERYPFGYAPYSYIAFLRESIALNKNGLLAYFNPSSELSLARNFMETEFLCGVEHRAPLVNGLEYNSDYRALLMDLVSFGDACFDPANPLHPMLNSFTSANPPISFVRSA